MGVSRLLAISAVAAVLSACSGGGNSIPNSSQSNSRSGAGPTSMTSARMGMWPRSGPAVHVCGPVTRGFARCASWIRTDIQGKAAAAAPSGYGPSDLQTAYALTTAAASNGSGITVAIVDAFDDPNAESDLQVYRAQFGLPVCSSSNGCFTKVSLGRRTNTGWAEEESLDVDMVSAICPNCKILLVEAASNSTSNLTTAEQYATAHANYVSNSWSGNESSASSTDNSYEISGKLITAATGDSGFNSVAQWPAILPGVVAVGGTSLTSVSPRAESAWSGAGSGCSTVYAQPSFQTTTMTSCTKRAQSDVSADADPNTGVAVYDTFRVSGWLVFGGTSVATPIIASVYALSGNTGGSTGGSIFAASTLYNNAGKLNDITTGSNGSCGTQICNAGVGWDGPTGEGSPNGTGAF